MASGLTRGRVRQILAIVSRSSEGKARALYEEVYGAVPAASVPAARVRASVAEACLELLNEE